MSSDLAHDEAYLIPRAKEDSAPAACSPPDWDVVPWRQLENCERVEKGDWVDVARDGWRDDPRWVPATKIGELVPDPAYPSHRVFRRILAPARIIGS